MGFAVRYLPHSVDISGGTALWINGIDRTSVEPNVALIEESGGSETDREFVCARSVTPSLPFSTSDLTVLSTIGFAGLPFIGAANLFTMFARELPFGGLPTAIATANHITITATDGILYPVSVRAGHNTVARLNLKMDAVLGTGISSGAAPIVYASGQAISSGAGQVSNIFTAGPVKYTISGGASHLVNGVTETGVDFGITCVQEGSDGDVYPSHCSIISRMPTLSFTTDDATQIALIGDGISVSSFASFFRKTTSGGQRVPPATTNHVSVTGTAGMVKPDNTNLTHKQPGHASFTYYPAKNTNTITISIAAAIPTS